MGCRIFPGNRVDPQRAGITPRTLRVFCGDLEASKISLNRNGKPEILLWFARLLLR